ncbi:MAG TPA: hypothetical protein VNU44_07455 [Bryobacteraceae bacterium]|jgi:hypothetical protein|nr:hypothetical protein [Bryobacteraceae bacterium]
MLDPVLDHLNRETLGITNRLFARGPVRHHARKFQRLRDPTTVVLAIKLDRKLHQPSITSLLRPIPGLALTTDQIKIRLNDDAARYILEKTCTDRSYGARPLRRALQKYIEDPLSEALIQGTLPRPSELEVYRATEASTAVLSSPSSSR